MFVSIWVLDASPTAPLTSKPTGRGTYIHTYIHKCKHTYVGGQSKGGVLSTEIFLCVLIWNNTTFFPQKPMDEKMHLQITTMNSHFA